MPSPILRATLWIFSLLLTGVVSTACALFGPTRGPEPTYSPRENVFFAAYEEVWRASQLALQNYPMRVNNMDLGVLETDIIKGFSAWTPPHDPEQRRSTGLSYKLSVRVIRGNVDGKEAHKVTIKKDIQVQRDFFSNPEPRPSDGLEESVILYRIGREILIERALQQAQKQKNQQ